MTLTDRKDPSVAARPDYPAGRASAASAGPGTPSVLPWNVAVWLIASAFQLPLLAIWWWPSRVGDVVFGLTLQAPWLVATFLLHLPILSVRFENRLVARSASIFLATAAALLTNMVAWGGGERWLHELTSWNSLLWPLLISAAAYGALARLRLAGRRSSREQPLTHRTPLVQTAGADEVNVTHGKGTINWAGAWEAYPSIEVSNPESDRVLATDIRLFLRICMPASTFCRRGPTCT